VKDDIDRLIAPVLRDTLKLLKMSLMLLDIDRVQTGGGNEEKPVRLSKLTEVRIEDRFFLFLQVIFERRPYEIVGLYTLSKDGLKETYFKVFGAKQFHGERAAQAELGRGLQDLLSFVVNALLDWSIDGAREYPETYPQFVVGWKRVMRETLIEMLEYQGIA
jgi:hypothetical protein